MCLATWHGDYVTRCWPRTADELTEDELASRAYLLKNTSPCPTCSFAIQKSRGCNHITCFNCGGHFCYLCSSWLDGSNPYEHFSKVGSSCSQRLWDMEEGDNADGNVSSPSPIMRLKRANAKLTFDTESIPRCERRRASRCIGNGSSRSGRRRRAGSGMNIIHRLYIPPPLTLLRSRKFKQQPHRQSKHLTKEPFMQHRSAIRTSTQMLP